MPESHVLDDLGAYAVGALDPHERAAVDAHLAACSQCRDQSTGYRRVATGLLDQTRIEAPPPGTWEGIAARLGTSSAGAPVTAPRELKRKPSRMRLVVIGWAATAAALAAVVGWTTFQALDDTNPSVQQLASSGDSNVIPLAGANPNATGRLYISDDKTQGGLAVTGMPTTPNGKTYQLWLVTPDQTWTAAGTFEVDAQGRALVKVAFPGPMRDFAGVTICMEPQPGSPSKWGELVLSGPVYE